MENNNYVEINGVKYTVLSILEEFVKLFQNLIQAEEAEEGYFLKKFLENVEPLRPLISHIVMIKNGEKWLTMVNNGEQ